MTIQLTSLRFCHSPELGEGIVLRPDFWGQQYDSEGEKPFVSGDQV